MPAEVLIKYWGLMLIQLFSIFWAGVASTTAVDLTLIGHIKGWRRIRYPKWLGCFISNKRLYGYEIVTDQHTHPQVLWFLLGAFLIEGGIFGLIVGVWQFVNDVDDWVLWAIAAPLYISAIAWLVFSKLWARKEYLRRVQDYQP
jgi:hypothetical protein